MTGTGNLIVVSAPSGAGKTTLVKMLLQHDPRVCLSISYTTRAPRPGEQNGREYNFVDIATFAAMRNRGDFLEWAEVHGNLYGTSRSWLAGQMNSGNDVLLEIDWQGAQQVRRLFPDAVMIFILPPSLAELERRLRTRGQDADTVIQARIAAALGEMRHVNEFDFAIMNNELQAALADLAAVVRSARLRVAHQRNCQPDMFRFLEQ
jgi:guanylate kinase